MTAPKVAKCGTESGYKRHKRLGQDACDQCRSAWLARRDGRVDYIVSGYDPADGLTDGYWRNDRGIQRWVAA